jgi:hypothetical protein
VESHIRVSTTRHAFESALVVVARNIVEAGKQKTRTGAKSGYTSSAKHTRHHQRPRPSSPQRVRGKGAVRAHHQPASPSDVAHRVRSTDPVSRLTGWLLADPKTHPPPRSSRARQGTKPKTATPQTTAVSTPATPKPSKQHRNPRARRLPSPIPFALLGVRRFVSGVIFLCISPPPSWHLGPSAPCPTPRSTGS